MSAVSVKCSNEKCRYSKLHENVTKGNCSRFKIQVDEEGNCTGFELSEREKAKQLMA